MPSQKQDSLPAWHFSSTERFYLKGLTICFCI